VGKGFVSSNLLSVHGKTIDVDELKTALLKLNGFKRRSKEELSIDVDGLDLKNSNDVQKLHKVVKGLKIKDKILLTLLKSNINSRHRPNIIFDMTMKDLESIEEIKFYADIAGYDVKNIHIIWVVNDYKVALQQNKERERRVRDDILINTHEMVSSLVNKIINGKYKLIDYMDGDFWIVFNKRFIDTVLKTSINGGSYLDKAGDVLYVKVKERGKEIDKSKITQGIIDKIKSYVPNPEVW